jgi:hypothetical protein
VAQDTDGREYGLAEQILTIALEFRFCCVELRMSWDAAFDEPVELPNGKTARTLRNAGEYIAKLPKAEHEQKAWQTAMHCLIEAAEGRGFIRFARMGMLQAIHREEEDHFGPGKRVAKEPHLGSQKVGEGPMSSNAETLARVILEIDRILDIRRVSRANVRADAKLAIEQILLEMDSNDAVGTAERVLDGYIGPTLVK